LPLSATVGKPGYTTYRLALDLAHDAATVYTIFGRSGEPMSFPPAFQVDLPFGKHVRIRCNALAARISSSSRCLHSLHLSANITPTVYCAQIGGVNPQFYGMQGLAQYAQYDSWLTVGMTEAESSTAISVVGDDVASWSETEALTTEDGAIFWMNPGDGPSLMDANGKVGKGAPTGNIVVAQLTVKTGSSFEARVNCQGHTNHGDNWESTSIKFHVGNTPTPLPCTTDALPTIPGTWMPPPAGQTTYASGSSTTLTCLPGYTQAPAGHEAATVLCTDGVFSPVSAVCTTVAPPPPVGSCDCSCRHGVGDFSPRKCLGCVGSLANQYGYVCASPFRTADPPNREADQACCGLTPPSPPPPPQTCLAPISVKHGTWSHPSSPSGAYDSGTVVVLTCDAGYTMDSASSATMTCDSTGLWQFSGPYTRFRCKDTSPISPSPPDPRCTEWFLRENAMLDKCCGRGIDCTSGLPAICDAACAPVYLMFLQDCKETISRAQPPIDMSSYHRVEQSCRRTAAATTTPPPPPSVAPRQCSTCLLQGDANGGGTTSDEKWQWCPLPSNGQCPCTPGVPT
jgi:hypothetical protein